VRLYTLPATTSHTIKVIQILQIIQIIQIIQIVIITTMQLPVLFISLALVAPSIAHFSVT
jgi:hypothetical protein